MSSSWSESANAAFGGGEKRTAHGDQRRADEAVYQARLAREARAKKEEDAREAKRMADATNFASSSSYPSLGGSKPVAAKAAPVMNFSKTVSTMAARAAAEEDAAKVAAAAAEVAAWSVPAQAVRYNCARAGRLNQAEDEHWEYQGEDDFDGQEAGEAGEAGEEEEDGEFNADLTSTRRRGDKGIW